MSIAKHISVSYYYQSWPTNTAVRRLVLSMCTTVCFVQATVSVHFLVVVFYPRFRL